MLTYLSSQQSALQYFLWLLSAGSFVMSSFDLPVGGRVGVVVRVLAFHQCGPGSISALGVKCGLSLLVLYSAAVPGGKYLIAAMRDFPPGTPVFPSHQKPTFDSICRKHL